MYHFQLYIKKPVRSIAWKPLRVEVESAEGVADTLQGLEALQAGGDGRRGLAQAGLAFLFFDMGRGAARHLVIFSGVLEDDCQKHPGVQSAKKKYGYNTHSGLFFHGGLSAFLLDMRGSVGHLSGMFSFEC